MLTSEMGMMVLAACLTGLASSLHCLGMCGGAISAMILTATPHRPNTLLAVFPLAALVRTMHKTSTVPPLVLPALPISPTTSVALDVNSAQPATVQHLPLVLAFNAGRIFSYSIAGAIVGALGSGMGALLMRDAMPLRLTLFVMANMVMLLAGFYIAGWTRGLTPLERAGAHLWRRISPLTKRLLPIENAGQSALLGAFWGWVPCGLVYGMLVVALASGNAVSGAAIMFAFGLGTLPAMTAAGMLSAQMKSLLRDRRLRVIAGAVVIVIALLGLNRVPVLAGLANYATLTELCHSIITDTVKIAR